MRFLDELYRDHSSGPEGSDAEQGKRKSKNTAYADIQIAREEDRLNERSR
jgi:hypothetical protein